MNSSGDSLEAIVSLTRTGISTCRRLVERLASLHVSPYQLKITEMLPRSDPARLESRVESRQRPNHPD
jgi:hypothetical protein